jgi:outer membrane autotransporter protein
LRTSATEDSVSSTAAFIGKALVLPGALAIAFYSSVIVDELLADDYGTEPTPAPLQPVTDSGHAISDQQHREKITTRTVASFEGPGKVDRWGAFASLSGSKETFDADRDAGQLRLTSKDQTLTTGLDRKYGNHLFGIALGASDGDVDVYLDQGGISDIERDKRSGGVYYGLALPKNVNLTGQVLFSDYEYESILMAPGAATDFAEYDGSGYSASVGAVAVIPFKIKPDRFDFYFEPSIYYLHVETDIDAYESRAGTRYQSSELLTREWLISMKWRKLFESNGVYFLPFGGFDYRFVDREVESAEGDIQRDQNILEGALGLTVQWGRMNLSASYRKSIDEKDYEREQYHLNLRVSF